MNERIRVVRGELDLTRAAFGKKLGVSGDVINNLERGRVEVKEPMIKLICSAYSVNEEWLRTGEGEMFAPTPSDTLDALAREYHLDRFGRTVVEKMLNLNEKQWAVFHDFAMDVLESLSEDTAAGKDIPIPSSPDTAGQEQTRMDVSRQEPPGKEEAENPKMPIPVSEDGQDELEGLVRKYKKNLTDDQQQQILEMMQAMITSQKEQLPASAQRIVDEKSPKTERPGQS